MIHTVVFDLGKVLVEFDPIKGMREIGLSEAAISALDENIFQGFWEECDKYQLTEDEVRARSKELVPGFEAEVDLLWDNLTKVTGVRPYAKEWLRDLKERGYRILVLSNYGQASFARNSLIYDFLELVDGKVISYEIEEVKPDAAIYQYLFEKYNLDPKNAVFIDDRAINIEAGEALGMKGIVFESYEQASQELNCLLKE